MLFCRHHNHFKTRVHVQFVLELHDKELGEMQRDVAGDYARKRKRSTPNIAGSLAWNVCCKTTFGQSQICLTPQTLDRPVWQGDSLKWLATEHASTVKA